LVIYRFEVYLTRLDPAVGAEMQKTRPCLVVSPDEMHRNVRTVIVAPLTSTKSGIPTRVPCRFAGRTGEVAIDHLRAVDRSRLVKRLGKFDDATAHAVAQTLVKLFG
jgi:mRNA interferase MazF